jgi:lipopolysaccharide transport system permease protein
LPYPAFVLAGTMLWAIFTDAVNAPLITVSAARDMLVRINFPREALIVSGIIQVAFNAAIKLAIVVAILGAFGLPLHWSSLTAFAGVALLILCGTCAGMLLLPVGLLYTDVLRVLPFLMQAMMYMTPVFYPLPESGTAREILLLNPVTGILEATRHALTGTFPVYGLEQLVTAGVALILIVLLWVVYRLALPIIIERMSS